LDEAKKAYSDRHQNDVPTWRNTGQEHRPFSPQDAQEMVAMVAEFLIFKKAGEMVNGLRGAPKSTSKIVNTTAKQLQKKFKHAKDFGVQGNYNPANAKKFNSAINQHLNAEGTQAIQGAYRNSNNLVTFHLNTETGLNVLTTRTGQFINGAKLSPAQVNDILTKGFLW